MPYNLVMLDNKITTASGDLANLITSASGGLKDYSDMQYLRIDGTKELSGHFLPEMTGASGSISVRDIGSPTQKFRNIYTQDVYIDKASLYVNGSKVITEDSGTIVVSTDPDQSLLIKTTGVADVSLVSDHSINLSSKGGTEFTIPANNPFKDITFANASSRGVLAFSATGLHGAMSVLVYDYFEVIGETVSLQADTDVTGYISTTSGFRFNGGATLGHFLRGDGENFIPALIGFSDLPSGIATTPQLLTTSGNIIAQIPINTVSSQQLTTTSGDILNWVNSHNYVLPATLTTVSGDIVAQIPVDFINHQELSTTSGNIVSWVSSQHYATEAWVDTQISTTSGSLVDYINTVSGSLRHGRLAPMMIDVGPYSEFQSIQEAIDSITIVDYNTDWYVIRIFPGTYVEDIIMRDNVDIQGINYDCIIEGTVSWPASRCSGELWSSLLNLGLTVYPTVSGEFTMLHSEAGQHDLMSCWFYMQVDVDDIESYFLKIDGGEFHSYSPEWDYLSTNTGNPGVTHHGVCLASGIYTEFSGDYTVSIGSQDENFVAYEIVGNNPGNKLDIIGGRLRIECDAPYFNGTIYGARTGCEGEAFSIQNTFVDITSIQGGTAYGVYLDSAAIGSSSSIMLTQSNRINISGFDSNYGGCCVNTTDLLVSHFNSNNAQDGFLGDPSSVAEVDSPAYGELALNKSITFYPSSLSTVDRTIFNVITGVSTNPKISYYNDYIGEPRLMWDNPDGASSFMARSYNGNAILGSLTTGSGAHNQIGRLGLGQDTGDPATGQRKYRWEINPDPSDLTLTRFWSTQSGEGWVPLMTIDKEGKTQLRYGTAVDRFLNESDMSSYSPYALPTQKSVVDYVGSYASTVSGALHQEMLNDEVRFTEYVNAYVKPYRFLSVSVSGGDFQSIQAAIDSITIEDFEHDLWVIQVHPGEYYEDVYLKDNVDLVGDSYDSCILEGSLNWLAASGCSPTAGLWSAVQNMTIQSFTSVSGFSTIYADAGNHDIVNCYVFTETSGVGANCLQSDGASVYSYLTEYEYSGLGDSPDQTHRCARIVTGDWESLSDKFVMRVEDSTNSIVCIGTQRSPNPDDYFRFQGASIDLFLTGSGYQGNVYVFRCRGTTRRNSVLACRLRATGPGTGYCDALHIDSSELGFSGGNTHSSANRFLIENFGDNRLAWIGDDDLLMSHFDDITCDIPSVCGNLSNYLMVSSEVDGQLRITDYLKIGRGLPGEHQLIEIDTGQGSYNPGLHFNGDYYGYTQGAFTTATGMGSFIVQTTSGHALAGSMVYGPTAHNYEPRMSLWTHNSTNDDRHAYRLRKKYQDESFAISRLWTFQHDSDADIENFVDVLNIDKDGGFKLRYGTRVNTIFDEDDFASNSASGVATQRSTKAYIASQLSTPDHASLTNLQGGAPSQYYHLDYSNYTTITGGGYLLKPSTLTPATKTKITYDQYGLVTAGTDATTDDIPDTSTKRYSSDAEKTMFEYSLATGLISGGALSKNVNNIDVNVTSGTSLFVDFTDPNDPLTDILHWDSQTISGGLSAEVGRLWIGVQRTAPGVGAFVKSIGFTHLEKRTTAVVGRIWSNGSDIIEGIGQYTSPAYGLDYALIDLIQSLGSLNRSGNIFTPTASGGMLLDKTSGEAFRFSANFGGEPTAPNVHTDPSMLGINAYHYHYYNTPTTVLHSTIDAGYYDVDGVLTTVSAGDFTVQRIHYYPKSDVVDIVYGQAIYTSLSDAELHAATESVNIDDANMESLYGSILRGYLVVRGDATDLSNPTQAKVITASNFGSAGSSAAVGGITVHNQLMEIQGGATGDYQHLTTAQVATFTSASGNIVSWVTTNYPNFDYLNTTSGNIINWVTNRDYATRTNLTTTSGDIISWVNIQSYITPARLTTVSGDIISQLNNKDHGTLLGLSNNNHPQYTQWSQNETISGNWAINTKLGFNNYTNSSPANGERWRQSDNDFRVRSNGVTLVDGMNSMIQCRQDSGTSRQDCNDSAGIVVNWNIEDFEDYGLYGHSTSTNPSRITVSGTAWYKISYSISFESQNALRKNIATQLRKNGTTMMIPGRCNSFAYNAVDANGTNYASSVHRLAAGDYIEVMASGIGSTGQALTTQLGGTYITVEFIRWSL